MRSARGSTVAALVALAVPAVARADNKVACVAAADEAQQLRNAGKLRAARERLVVCARRECPAIVRNDCTVWTTEVVAALPTIVLGARDATGRDLATADVTIDGVTVTGALDGKPVDVDPGAHVVRFVVPGSAPVEERVVIREGEKARPILATFGPPATPVDESSSFDTPAPRAPSPWTWALGGLGLVAVGVGTYLEVSANAGASRLESECGHDCSHAQVEPLIVKQRILGPIGFGVGAASLGAATYFFFARPVAGSAPRVGWLEWVVVPVTDGGMGGVAGRF